MARIRSIKPEFWADEVIASWEPMARLAYIAMWNEADDEGRLRASMPYLRSRLFPYDPASFTQAAMDAIVNSGKLVLYLYHGQTYGQLVNFAAHQVINRRTASRIPKHDDPECVITADSRSTHGALTDDSVSPHSGKGREGMGMEGREREREAMPPTPVKLPPSEPFSLSDEDSDLEAPGSYSSTKDYHDRWVTYDDLNAGRTERAKALQAKVVNAWKQAQFGKSRWLPRFMLAIRYVDDNPGVTDADMLAVAVLAGAKATNPNLAFKDATVIDSWMAQVKPTKVAPARKQSDSEVVRSCKQGLGAVDKARELKPDDWPSLYMAAFGPNGWPEEVKAQAAKVAGWEYLGGAAKEEAA